MMMNVLNQKLTLWGRSGDIYICSCQVFPRMGKPSWLPGKCYSRLWRNFKALLGH